ncbi:sensor histidine kinase, partial [Halobellus sp. Atlit-38R]|uniref:sensor histidine kinase n=1 Tax=Halobellus sp. Atlit-38R TaxID=2282131 RepID=UPI000F247EC8
TATLDLGTDDTIVEADRDRLEEAFENLFRKAIEHGGDDVTVGVGKINNGFYVEDSGDGIPDDAREQVFDHGYSTGEGGTGFGLSIVRSIIEGHGWSITVADASADGARFEITDVQLSS